MDPQKFAYYQQSLEDLHRLGKGDTVGAKKLSWIVKNQKFVDDEIMADIDGELSGSIGFQKAQRSLRIKDTYEAGFSMFHENPATPAHFRKALDRMKDGKEVEPAIIDMMGRHFQSKSYQDLSSKLQNEQAANAPIEFKGISPQEGGRLLDLSKSVTVAGIDSWESQAVRNGVRKSLEQGKPEDAKRIIKQAAISKLPGVAVQKEFIEREAVVDGWQRIEKKLLTYEKNNPDSTGFFTGKMQKVMTLFGKSLDTDGNFTGEADAISKEQLMGEGLSDLEAEMSLELFGYIKFLSGVAVSDAERKQIQKVLPAVGKDFRVNMAQVRAVSGQMMRRNQSVMKNYMSEADYNSLWRSGDKATTTPDAAPGETPKTSAPKLNLRALDSLISGNADTMEFGGSTFRLPADGDLREQYQKAISDYNSGRGQAGLGMIIQQLERVE